MQIGDQSFIHGGDRRLLSESFPKFFRKSIMVCNVHLSVFTIWSKYFRNRHVWILIHLSRIVVHNTRHFPKFWLRSNESFGNISWKRWKQRNLNKEWFSTSLRYRLKFARAKKVGGPPKPSPGKIFNVEPWRSWCDWLKKTTAFSIKYGFFFSES